MSATKIIWKPLPTEGDPLTVLNADAFIFAMQTVFKREWPMTLTAKDLDKLEGMAGATLDVGNPFLTLLGHLKRFKAIVIWPDYGGTGLEVSFKTITIPPHHIAEEKPGKAPEAT